mgnify:CR=1 FL=1
MQTPRRTIFVVFEDFQLLDMSGPAAVFHAASDFMEGLPYEIVVASVNGGSVRSSCGAEIGSIPLSTVSVDAKDTVLAVGGTEAGLRSAVEEEGVPMWLHRAADAAERIGSVCVGAFLLGAAGLLDGKQVCSHWRSCGLLEESFPKARVDADALYTCDGALWSSAGVSSGIDMALAMIEADHGADLKARIARGLVVYAHRPGLQSQFSEVLQVQSRRDGRFADVLDWIGLNLHVRIRAEELADRAGMSHRSFLRHFQQSIGSTPARYVEQLRLARAKEMLENGAAVKTIPGQIGYRSEAAFRTAFERRFAHTPNEFKRLHGR